MKTKGHALETMYWPHINNDIEELTHHCEPCLQYQNKLKQETLIPHNIPDILWTKVGTDLFELNGKDYVIVVDYTTNFYDISQIPDKHSSTVVLHTKRIFSKFGIPKTVMSDNGPEYIGKAYERFSKQWDFAHDSSSLVYPESNGQVERTIQLVKKTLRKAFVNNDDPYLALLTIRVSPGPYDNPPPATLFFNRPIRSTLPSMNNNYQTINKKLSRNMKITKHCRDLPELSLNDKVRLHDGKSWSIKGKVVDVSTKPRSYIILTENGSKLRRNRKQILRTKTSSDLHLNEDSYSLIDFSETDNLIDIQIPDIPPPVVEQFDPIPVVQQPVIQPVLPNNDLDGNAMPEPTVTRSGRVINIPQRYSEYEMQSP